MNQAFDLNRFLLLAGKHWSENRKKYLLALVAMAGLLLILYSFLIIIDRTHPVRDQMQAVTYFAGLFITGCFYASFLFSDLNDQPKAINYLLVPASALEKLLCALVYGVLLFFICYTVIFYLIDVPMVKLANSLNINYWKEISPGYTYKPDIIVNVFSVPDRSPDMPNIFYFILLIYLSVQSAFILGSVYFSRFSFIKTCISLLLFFLFWALFMGKVASSIMPHGSYYDGLTSYRILQNGHYEVGVKLPDWIESVLVFLFKYAFAPVFWITTYFRLKEKEV